MGCGTMTKLLKKGCLIIILLLLVGLMPVYGSEAEYSAAQKKTLEILLINSYHDGYIWSRDLIKGVQETLEENFEGFNLRIEHMDTKNISSPAYFEELRHLYSVKYEKNQFDVILSADDNALRFLMQYRDDLFGQTPVFFCGVNTLSVYPSLEETELVYGVSEKNSMADTVAVAIRQNPEIKDVYLVVEDTITGKSTKTDVKNVMRNEFPNMNLHIFEEMTIFQIRDKVKTLDPAHAIVVYAFYAVDIDGTVHALDYPVILLTEASSVPVYSLFTFGFATGSVGGKLIEGYTQGARMVELMADYLQKGYLEERFIEDNTFNRYKFDYNALTRYGLSVDLLPKESVIINQPKNFYQDHKLEINISFFMLFMLIAYLAALRYQISFQTFKIETAQRELLEAEKLASLGRLVAGVAHEVNTPIGIGVTLASHIKTISNKMGKAVEDGSIGKHAFMSGVADLQTSSDQLLETMEKASELIKSFKRVAIDQVSEAYRDVNIGQYLSEIVSSLSQELKKKNVEIRIICEEEISLWVHAGAIYQLTLNLIMNSLLHGFEGRDSGMIDITASKISKNEQAWIRIRYRDYGVGMTTDVLEHIYDPFFTTKRDAGGNGLGMSIVYDLVTQTLAGTIECSSAEQAGTEFIIEFPVAEGRQVTQEIQ